MRIQEFDRKLAKILKPSVKDRIYMYEAEDGQFISDGHIIARINDCPKVKALLIEQDLPLTGTYVTHLGQVNDGRTGWQDEFKGLISVREGEKAQYTGLTLNGQTNVAVYKTEQDLQIINKCFHELISDYGETWYVREKNLIHHQSLNGGVMLLWIMRHRFCREYANAISNVIAKFSDTKIED